MPEYCSRTHSMVARESEIETDLLPVQATKFVFSSSHDAAIHEFYVVDGFIIAKWNTESQKWLTYPVQNENGCHYVYPSVPDTICSPWKWEEETMMARYVGDGWPLTRKEETLTLHRLYGLDSARPETVAMMNAAWN